MKMARRFGILALIAIVIYLWARKISEDFTQLAGNL
jgi:hypothetical protein